MGSLELTGSERVFLGAYLIIHGLIHLVFLIYVHDHKNKTYVGWSRKSWLLDRLNNPNLTKYFGLLVWSLVAILFTLSGLAVFDIISKDYTSTLIIIASIAGSLTFFVFYDGLAPTGLHWILGVAVNIVLIFFMVIWKVKIIILLVMLIFIWLYGMFVHTKIIPKGNLIETLNP